MISKTNYKKSFIKRKNKSCPKKGFYDLYKNPFIDLTDDEKDNIKIHKIEENSSQNGKKNKNNIIKIIPIYQEEFCTIFERENIFNKYKIFNQKLKGDYKFINKIFENLFKKNKNLYKKEIFDNNNQKNNRDILSERNYKIKNDISNFEGYKNINKYSSLENMLESLKIKILLQRKRLINNLLKNNSKKYEKDKNNNSKENFYKFILFNKRKKLNQDGTNRIEKEKNKLFLDKKFRNNSDCQFLTIKNDRPKNNCIYKLFNNLKFHNKSSKIKEYKTNLRDKIIKLNEYLKNENSIKRNNIATIIITEKKNLFHNICLNNNNKNNKNINNYKKGELIINKI